MEDGDDLVDRVALKNRREQRNLITHRRAPSGAGRQRSDNLAPSS